MRTARIAACLGLLLAGTPVCAESLEVIVDKGHILKLAQDADVVLDR